MSDTPTMTTEREQEIRPAMTDVLRDLTERNALRTIAGLISSGKGRHLMDHHVEVLTLYAEAMEQALAELERVNADAARYRFLRDNPIQLRAIDGNAGFHGQWSAVHFDRFTDQAIEDCEAPSHV